MKLAILGAGNIGGATAAGLLRSGAVLPRDLSLTAAHQASLETFESLGVRCGTDNAAAVRGADAVLLAVKPWIVPDVVAQIAPVLDYDAQLVVSLAPGVAPEALLELFSPYGKPALAYFIPNTAVEICESMSFLAPVTASEADLGQIYPVLEALGPLRVIPFGKLPAATALASCGIAYALRYIRAAAEGGVELGIPATDAVSIVAQTVKGAAALLEAHGTHPEAEIDRVTTPGGLTIKGLNAMDAAGFSAAVVAGLKAGKV